MTTYRFIHAEEANHSVRTLCEVLTVARSAYNEWRKGLTHTGRRDLDAETRVRAVFEAHKGRYGAPRVAAELRMGERFPIGRKRVARLMRKFGMVARPRRRFRGTTTDSDHDLPVAENLLQRQFSVPAPKMAVVGDITYLPTRAGWVYLAVLIDLHSRKVVGWAMDTHMETELCLTAFDRMVASRGDMTGAIVHHDRGSQYASRASRRRVEAAKMKLSMSRKGNCWDNAVAESFFGTLEQELAPDLLWADLEEARAAVSNYIHRYYNIKRRHSTLGYKTPVEFEANHQASRGIAA